MIVHRPSEECYINVWFTVKEDYVNVLPFEDMENTELNHGDMDEIMGIQS